MKLQRLKLLYEQIAEHTRKECAGENCGCLVPHSCCHAGFCESAIRYAKKRYGVEIVPTGHEKLPCMGPNGCIVEPYLRPICAIHACCICGIGAKVRGEGAAQWTAHYFELREEIEDLEWELNGEPDGGFEEVFHAMEEA